MAVILILLRKLNYRNIQLCSVYTSETVGVRMKSGDLRYLPFLGFANKSDVIAHGCTPVLMDISGYYESVVGELIKLDASQWVQGAMVRLGVYAVIDSEGSLIIIDRT